MVFTQEDSFHREVTHTLYARRRRGGLFGKYLPFKIVRYPRSLGREAVGEDSGSCIVHCSNKFLVKRELKFLAPLIFGLVFLFLSLGSLYAFYADDHENVLDLSATILFAALLLLTILYYFFSPEKYLILNRRDTCISFPNILIGKPFTMPFNNIRLGISHGGNVDGKNYLAIKRPMMMSGAYLPHFDGENYFEELGFLIWYMDKNRPLPPGAAFDDYRKQDYKDRKAEGFPPPIFASVITTLK